MTEEVAEDSNGATEAEPQEIVDEGQSEPQSETQDLPEERFYEIEGEEVSEADVIKWKSGHMKDADYTQKTQALAADRKAFQSEREKFNETFELLTAMEDEISGYVMGDLQNIDMEDLRINDPSEYLRIEKLKQERSQWRDKLSTRFDAIRGKNIENAQKFLFEKHGWQDAEKLKTDTDSIMSWVKESGMPETQFQKITDPYYMSAILEASKYRKLMEQKPSITKKVVQAPKTSKPSSQPAAKKPLSLAERMYGAKS